MEFTNTDDSTVTPEEALDDCDISVDEQITRFCENVDLEQPRRDEELFKFLEELICSQEFRKQNDTAIDACTQVIPRYLDKYAEETKAYIESIIEDFHLTKYFQKRHRIEGKQKLKEECAKKRKIRASQEEAIAIIKEHILQVAESHACHLHEKIKNKFEKIVNMLANIESSTEFKSKFTEHVISIKRTKYLQKIGRKKREVAIINKLLLERKRLKQIQAIQNKTYDYKVKKREKIGTVETQEVVIEQIISGAETLAGIEELPLEEPEERETVEEKESTVKTSKKKEKKSKKEKSKKKSKKDKQPSEGSKSSKKSKRDKKGKKDKKNSKKDKKNSKKDKKKGKKKEDADLVLPNIPISNPRLKIIPGDPEYMIDIIRKHEELLKVVDERKYFDEILDEKELYEKDTTSYWKPNPILFNNFENGKIYRKKVTIINGGNVSKKIKLYAAIIDDGFDPYLINVDNFGISLVVPGLSFTISITFRPRQLKQVTYGKLIFISIESHKDFYCQFAVPIKCIPLAELVFVTPIHINFGQTPCWEVKNMKPKLLKVISSDKKSYTVSIKKILDESDVDVIAQSVTTPSEYNITQILCDITSRCHGAFVFSKYLVALSPRSCIEIKVFPKNLDSIRTYFQRYECQFYEELDQESRLVGCQECIISAEITGHFIQVEPNVLDFGVCTFGSIYQQGFHITNCDLVTHRIFVQFPSVLKQYLSSNVAEVFLQPNTTREIAIKIMPREDMVDGFQPFFDSDTNILQFPVKVMVTSKNSETVPPLKITVFAILSDNLGLSIRPLNLEFTERTGEELLLNLGKSMTRECVVAKVGITNSAATPQHFGFLDLPECITIAPNYGFGFLDPYESKELKLLFWPEFRDIEACNNDCPMRNLTFRISVTTIKRIGAMKKTFNHRKLRKSFEQMMAVLKCAKDDSLENDMSQCLGILKNSDEFIEMMKDCTAVEVTQDGVNFEIDDGMQQAENHINDSEGTKSVIENINSNKMWLSADLIDPVVWFSHQYIRLPNTPCGSFSTVPLKLKSQTYNNKISCYCGAPHCEVDGLLQFDVHFEIYGNNPEITIEPICGDLTSGKSVDLHLIAKPNVPENVVEEKARHIKMMDIIAEKRKQQILKRQKEREARLLREQKLMEQKMKKEKKKGGKKKGKKNKASKSSKSSKSSKGKGNKDSTPESDVKEKKESLELPFSDIFVDPNTINVNYFDMYPAEMVIWRDFEPTVIEADFVCEVTYSGKNINKTPDILYLKAVCKIVSPSFIHNLNRQHVDFGLTAIGDSRRTILELQNIKDDIITPRISYLSPVGPFSCPNINDVRVPAEHILKIPICFKPNDERDSLPAALPWKKIPRTDAFWRVMDDIGLIIVGWTLK